MTIFLNEYLPILAMLGIAAARLALIATAEPELLLQRA